MLRHTFTRGTGLAGEALEVAEPADPTVYPPYRPWTLGRCGRCRWRAWFLHPCGCTPKGSRAACSVQDRKLRCPAPARCCRCAPRPVHRLLEPSPPERAVSVALPDARRDKPGTSRRTSASGKPCLRRARCPTIDASPTCRRCCCVIISATAASPTTMLRFSAGGSWLPSTVQTDAGAPHTWGLTLVVSPLEFLIEA